MIPNNKSALTRARKASFWEDPEKYEAQHMLISPLERRIVGAICGALLGVLYALVAGTIDFTLFRDLPLRLEWPRILISALTTGAAGLAVGAVVAWPGETLKGIIAGALVIAGSGAVKSLLTPAADTTVMVIVLVYTFLPFVALSLPIAIAIRLIVNRYEDNLQKQGQSRLVAQGILLAGAIALAAFAGSWSQMPPSSVEAVRKIDRMIQTTLASPADKALPIALRSLSDFRARAGTTYLVDQRKSVSVTDGVDVQVNFDNGYVISCLVDNQTLAVSCVEGASVFGPFQFNPNDQR
ncbi:MAG: hypothetical protein HYZ49_03165 [Chloroflexi bacterium]|nr:hypothetical protein [Chloroflexota bacterium]